MLDLGSINLLATTLSRLHNSALVLPPSNLRERVQTYREYLVSTNQRLRFTQEEEEGFLETLIRLREDAPIHGDMHGGNVLLGKEDIYLVD